MSRIGKKPVPVPENVKVHIADRTITIEGPLGKLQWQYRPEVAVEYDSAARQIMVRRTVESRQAKALHGLTRALIQNMVVGVTQGYEKRLEIKGIGYSAALQGNVLHLRVGFANELRVPIPPGLKVTCPDPQRISIKGIDKQLVGQFAAEVRSKRKRQPYKYKGQDEGKGICYEGETMRWKEGKAAVK